jgi:hypothetical protein
VIRLGGRWKGAGNREVSRFVGRMTDATDEKGVHGGNRVSPVGASLRRATGVEVDW